MSKPSPTKIWVTNVQLLVRVLARLLLAVHLVAPWTASAQEAEAPVEAAPPAATLLEILRDEAALDTLIAELERATVAAEVAGTPPVATLDPQSLGRRIALVTQDAAETTANRLAALWSSLRNAPDALDGFSGREFEVLADALGELFLVIVTTVAVFLALRRLAIPIYRRMGARARERGFLRTAMIYIGSGAIDVLVVLAAWAIGYAIALLVFGDFGEIAIRQTLYLNAFLAVEMIKVGMRLLLSPATGDLRPLPLGDRAARYLSRRGNVLFSLIGYGQLLVVPIVNESVSHAAGRAMSTLIWSTAILYVAYLVLRNRHAVSDWLLAQTRPAPAAPATAPAVMPEVPDHPGGTAPAHDMPDLADDATPQRELPDEPEPEPEVERRRGIFAPLAHSWHWIALAYLLVILLVVLSRPGPAIFDALIASGKIALALVLGLFLSGALARAIARGINLPPGANARRPLLERRLNRFVPQALLVLRLVIVAAVAVYALDVIGILSARGWLESQVGLRLTGVVISVALMLLVAFLIWLALTSWVDYRLNPDFGQVPTAREQTLLTLLRNAATIALVILTLMFVLSEIGLDIGPLLASAGVLGLAIGFGAQKMVQDIITGIFIQFENAINVGDVISAGGITGGVERLTIRSVSLRALQGIYHIIPFSSVDTVSNYTREFSYYVIDMGVAYRENYDEVKQAMHDAFDELRAHPDQGAFILGDLDWFGLDAFGDSAVVLKCRIKTLPAKQWGVGRAYNQIVKRIFDERNIEIPFPHQTIYFGEGKDGSAPPLHLSNRRASSAE